MLNLVSSLSIILEIFFFVLFKLLPADVHKVSLVGGFKTKTKF